MEQSPDEGNRVLLGLEAALKVADGGRVGQAVLSKEVEEFRHLAQGAQVLGTASSGEDGGDHGQDVIAFLVGAVIGEEIQMRIESLVEAGARASSMRAATPAWPEALRRPEISNQSAGSASVE